MKVRAGYKIAYGCAQPTPMILTLSVRPERCFDLITEDMLTVHPFVPITEYVDGFGNICHVIRAPQGWLTLSSDFFINDSGEPDAVAPLAPQLPLDTLPVDTLVYLLGSGGWCRRSAISSTSMSPSATSMPMSAAPRMTLACQP